MMWRSALSPSGGEIDPEHEQELRLIAHTRAGAAWALSALVARYQPLVVRYLVRLTGDPRRSHKLAETIFVRMSRRLRGPHGGDHLRLWLLRASTDAGLDALRRQPNRTRPDQLGAPAGPMGLLTGKVNESAVGRLLNAWSARPRPVTAREATPVREFVWQSHAEFDSTGAATGGPDADSDEDGMTPRDVLRHRMMRAVLAELPFGDAQCLALHLVAGLNQADVAQALSITLPVAQRRIVQGLQLFGRHYDAALASIGLTSDFDTAATEQATFELDATAAPVAMSEPVVDATPSPSAGGARLASPEDVADTAPFSAVSIAGAAPVATPDDIAVSAIPNPLATAPQPVEVDVQAAPEEAPAPAVEPIAQHPSPPQEPLLELAHTMSGSPTGTGDRIGGGVDLGAGFAAEQPMAAVATFDQSVGADESASTEITDRVPDEEPAQPVPALDEASAAAAPAAQQVYSASADPADAGWAMPHIESDNSADQIAPEEGGAPPELGGDAWARAAPEPAPAAADVGDDLSRVAVPTTPRATGRPGPVETHTDVPTLTAPDTEDVPEEGVNAVPEVPEAEHLDGAAFVAGTAQPVDSAALATETEQPFAAASAPDNPASANPAPEAESDYAAALLDEPATGAPEEQIPPTHSSTQTQGEELDDISDHDDTSTAPHTGRAQIMTAAAIPEDEEFTLVVEPEPHYTVLSGDTTMAHSLRARRRRVLSADGEAEDPVEPTGDWPGS